MKRRMSRHAWQIALKPPRLTSSELKSLVASSKMKPARKCDVPCRSLTCSTIRGNPTYKLYVLPKIGIPKTFHNRSKMVLRTHSSLGPTYRQLSAMDRKKIPARNQIFKVKVNSAIIKGTRSASCCPCPTCCPPPGCTLPPPCNQPPKCLQSMTGYYHYPYGFWFCGPYHVSTGPVPIDGPVKPGGVCGPVAGPCNPCAPFNPCGPCAPCGPCGPCPPCGPCAPCAPCAPCVPCGPCGVCAPCGLCALCHAQPAPAAAPQWNTNYTHGSFCNQCGYPKPPAAIPKQTTITENAVPKNLEAKSVDTLPSKVAAQSLSTILDHASTRSTIEIDPTFIKTFPFNKPTFKRTESFKQPTTKKPK
ncbi:hypothetical protein RR46_01196 [Papilio xuthus]|uniref:Uncharacterized protein n=1 Tax=Papilio xuthus TaxID=66420 RepID=A0A0N1I3W9_PAPXU|nr:hypothetical protein RR46_01196 [Papilio xuthus]